MQDVCISVWNDSDDDNGSGDDGKIHPSFPVHVVRSRLMKPAVELKVTDICSTNPADATYCATPADIKIDRIKADLLYSNVKNRTAAENDELASGNGYDRKVYWFFSKCWDDVRRSFPYSYPIIHSRASSLSLNLIIHRASHNPPTTLPKTGSRTHHCPTAPSGAKTPSRSSIPTTKPTTQLTGYRRMRMVLIQPAHIERSRFSISAVIGGLETRYRRGVLLREGRGTGSRRGSVLRWDR